MKIESMHRLGGVSFFLGNVAVVTGEINGCFHDFLEKEGTD